MKKYLSILLVCGALALFSESSFADDSVSAGKSHDGITVVYSGDLHGTLLPKRG